MFKPYVLMLYDSVALGFFMYLSIFLSFYIIKPFTDSKISMNKISISLGLSVSILSFIMMFFSGKYFNNPIQNSNSKTFWTWWKIK